MMAPISQGGVVVWADASLMVDGPSFTMMVEPDSLRSFHAYSAFMPRPPPRRKRYNYPLGALPMRITTMKNEFETGVDNVSGEN